MLSLRASLQILSGVVTFSDGSTLAIGALNNDGSATTFNFATKTFKSLNLSITSVSSTTLNVGLSEFQVFYVTGSSACVRIRSCSQVQ